MSEDHSTPGLGNAQQKKWQKWNENLGARQGEMSLFVMLEMCYYTILPNMGCGVTISLFLAKVG
jgi:hypothetical protein